MSVLAGLGLACGKTCEPGKRLVHLAMVSDLTVCHWNSGAHSPGLCCPKQSSLVYILIEPLMVF